MTTIEEIILAMFLLIGFKTESVARLSGWLLLIFALAMSFSTGIGAGLFGVQYISRCIFTRQPKRKIPGNRYFIKMNSPVTNKLVT